MCTITINEALFRGICRKPVSYPKKAAVFPPIHMPTTKKENEHENQSVNNASRPEWKSKVSDERLKIYSGQVELEAGLANMQSIVDAASAK